MRGGRKMEGGKQDPVQGFGGTISGLLLMKSTVRLERQNSSQDTQWDSVRPVGMPESGAT